VRRLILLALGLTLAAARPVPAATFSTSPIAPELGIDSFTRKLTRDQLGRDLFANPWSTVTISNVDLYDRFPYVESRQFLVVSDPRWNRLVYGESGRTLRAFDGQGTVFGPLSNPRGMAVDENNRVYVADAGNNRILVLQASTEFGDVELVPIFEIAGLSGPYDVAYSDGGTPFHDGDDYLYVADTGRNRIASYALESARARLISTIGDLGGGTGRFAGPLAIAAGRTEGANNAEIYVADAHNHRIVHLRNQSGALSWVSDARLDADLLTSLDTDQWGNLYASAPRQALVRKFAPDLTPVAEIRDGLSSPHSFRVPFANVRDHRAGTVSRIGQPVAVSVENWSEASGIRRWNLGLEISKLTVGTENGPAAFFTLSDRATVSIEVLDVSTGRWLARRSAGVMDAGVHTLPLKDQDVAGAGGADALILRVSAVSSYANGPSDVAQTEFSTSGAGAAAPARTMLLGNIPNPVASFTRIAFLLPASGERVSLSVYDAMGRRVRTFSGSFTPGLNEVVWDGSDEWGRRARAGVYLYRLDVGRESFTRRMVLIR
jgi:sugar lactone lactonase YvrE